MLSLDTIHRCHNLEDPRCDKAKADPAACIGCVLGTSAEDLLEKIRCATRAMRFNGGMTLAGLHPLIAAAADVGAG